MKITKRDVFLYYSNLLDTEAREKITSSNDPKVKQWLVELDPVQDPVEKLGTMGTVAFKMMQEMEQLENQVPLSSLLTRPLAELGDALRKLCSLNLGRSQTFPAAQFGFDPPETESPNSGDQIFRLDGNNLEIDANEHEIPYGLCWLIVVDQENGRKEAILPILTWRKDRWRWFGKVDEILNVMEPGTVEVFLIPATSYNRDDFVTKEVTDQVQQFSTKQKELAQKFLEEEIA